MFPADNVILAKNKDQVIKCEQCCHDIMRLGHIFPQSSGKNSCEIISSRSLIYLTQNKF